MRKSEQVNCEVADEVEKVVQVHVWGLGNRLDFSVIPTVLDC